MRQLITSGLELAGMASVTAGTFIVFHAIGFIVLGVFLMLLGYLLGRNA